MESCNVLQLVFMLSSLVLCIHSTSVGDIFHFPADKKPQPLPAAIPEIHATVIPVVNDPYHPYTLEFHMTRYYGGCYGHDPTRRDNQIIPFIRNFQLIITTCGVNFEKGTNSGGAETCVFKWDDNDPMQLAHYQRFKITYNPNELKRIHVHSDRRHQRYFMDVIFPKLKQRAEITKECYIIHSGGGDLTVFPDYGSILQASPFVEKWIVEQNKFEEINAMSKVVLLPIGICPRENNFYGKELRVVIHESTHPNETLHVTPGNNQTRHHHHEHPDNIETDHHLRRRLSQENSRLPSTSMRSSLTNTSSTYTDRHYYMKRLLQAVETAKNFPWENRLNKIFFCFSDGAENRKDVLTYIRNTEGLSDFCDHCEGELTRFDLWMKYIQYKFVFAPWGNGADCGRNWEIMLLGAIPVIQYFPGAYGYVNAGLSVILMRNNTELNRENLTKWSEEYTKPNPLEKLSVEYWTKYLFNN
jgi:hypothetical protein